MSSKLPPPIPVFDTLQDVIDQYKEVYADENPHQVIRHWLDRCFAQTKRSLPDFAVKDYHMALNFLDSYRGSTQTFSAYRRDLERLLQWSWCVRHQSFLNHKREDIEAFIEFCLNPPKRWMGFKNVSRFQKVESEKVPNPEWRPFQAHVSKKDYKKGLRADKNNYQFSQPALKALFGILGSFYIYLLQEQVIQANPLVLLRQKSKFLQKQTKTQRIRRLSNQQWDTVLTLAQNKATQILPMKEPFLSCLVCSACTCASLNS